MKIALEFKYRKTKLSRPQVDNIVGTAIKEGVVIVGDMSSGCVIIKCRNAAKTAYKSAEVWGEKGVEVHIDECLSSYDEKYGG